MKVDTYGDNIARRLARWLWSITTAWTTQPAPEWQLRLWYWGYAPMHAADTRQDAYQDSYDVGYEDGRRAGERMGRKATVPTADSDLMNVASALLPHFLSFARRYHARVTGIPTTYPILALTDDERIEWLDYLTGSTLCDLMNDHGNTGEGFTYLLPALTRLLVEQYGASRGIEAAGKEEGTNLYGDRYVDR